MSTRYKILVTCNFLVIHNIVERNDVNRGLAGAVNLKEVKIRGQYYVISLLREGFNSCQFLS